MRHLKRGRKLGRTPAHRRALLRNLARALILHGKIVTTLPKAKELRPFIEKLITLAKKGTLHARRLAISRLHDKQIVKLLFEEVAPRYAERPGGYTRIIKRHERRLGDGGYTAYIALLGEDEPLHRERAETTAPAPAVQDEEEDEEETTNEADASEEESNEEAEEKAEDTDENKDEEKKED